ncbi:hypothetical protein BP5796_10765 [Coleophoma crateriformis]|uniref:Uncharacterized protein n=1 Tax=Coleophoma crateriformis TaxID=565419 RepID=A0A3D8QR26_9HELO|nr:hypothetical protein BP5796_10765 [Coleophoma crateriformis]
MASPVPIAVIGMGCRLPGGANGPEKLWDMLAEGRSGWSEVPSDRWNWKSFYNPNPEAKESVNSKSGYFLQQDIASFDARFFNIPVWEAHAMDPQQRILLETTYEALENAGISLQSIRGSDTAVYVGMYARDYDRMGYKDLPQITKIHITGTGEAVVSNRISYLFDLRGASLTVDTGCSGSMVALHQACQALRTRETGMAIVGGTQLLLHPDQSIPMSMVGMVNPNGRCFVFDSRGSGYARGEGVGTVVLKRLDDALEAGDPIHAVIRNSALNQDGKTAGISLPNADAQAALMRLVYANAGLDPRDTTYVEAHGTGTQAGDNAEISSISSVFTNSPRDTDLYVGSIKSNIGHLEASSGVAGLIKAIMILKKGAIPPNIDFIKPKDTLKLEERNIKIPLSLTPLPQGGSVPSRVSLNSFGYGGTNAHVILESAPAAGTQKAVQNGSVAPNGERNGISKAVKSGPVPRLVVLTAASEDSLRSTIKSLHQWVTSANPKSFSIEDLAYTLSLRRSILPWRYSVVASSQEELASALDQPNPRICRAAATVLITFIFTGQGAQWYAMGRELVTEESNFRKSIQASDRILADLGCQWSLLEELLKDEKDSKLGESELSQPTTTAIQLALVDLFASFGIRPQSVCGHSSGEIAAAYTAGALSHREAIEAAYRRGLWSAAAKKLNKVKGAMLAVGIGEKEVLPYVKKVKAGVITIACVNSPSSTTISGDEAGIDELKEILDELSVFNRKLKVDSAYHSHHMQTVAKQYQQSIENIKAKVSQPDIQFYSSVTGTKKNSDFSAAYWTQNLVSKVKFSTAVQLLAKDMKGSRQSSNVFVEIGPHGALAGPLRQTLATISSQNFKYVYASALTRGQNALKTVLEASGQLFDNGYPVDLEAIMSMMGSEDHRRIVTDLSPYSWDHSAKFWHESRLSREHRMREFPYHDLLGLLDVNSNIHEPRWRYHINVDTIPWLKDHVIEGDIIFPGSGYICMAIEAMKQITQIRKVPGTVSKVILRDINFLKPIIVPEPSMDGFTPEIEVQLVLSRSKGENSRWESFRIFSLSGGKDGHWSEHCSGRITVEMASKLDEVEGNREEDYKTTEDLKRLQTLAASSTTNVKPQQFYDELKQSGNDFGPAFAAMTEIKYGNQQSISRLDIPNIASVMPFAFMQPHIIHPTTLDAINQLVAALFKRHCSNSPLMPVYMGEISLKTSITNSAGEELVVASDIYPEGNRSATGNCWAFQKDTDGNLVPVFSTIGLRIRGIGDSTSSESVPFQRKMSYRISWQPAHPNTSDMTVDPASENNQPTESISETEKEKVNGDLPAHSSEPLMKAFPKVQFVSVSNNAAIEALYDKLLQSFEKQGILCTRTTWDKVETDSKTVYIVLDHLDCPVLSSPSPERWAILKNFFLKSSSVLWASIRGKDSTAAFKGLITGVARVVRRENEGLKLVTVDVNEETLDSLGDITEALWEIAEASFWPVLEPEASNELEYSFQNNILLVPRLQVDDKFNTWVDRAVKTSDLEMALYQQANRPLMLEVETPGLLNSLRFVDDLAALVPLAAHEVEIEATAYGVNFKDVFIALGQMLPGVNMVGEVAGFVKAVGADFQDRFKVGDRVAAVGARPFASHARVSGFQACVLPDSMSFTVGASIPTVFLTAYQCIFEVARLRKNQTILIHAASGGVGQAAIMFAQHIGAEIFATVGSATKRQLLIDRYGIPASHIFSTRSRTFKDGVLRLTNSKGVDVVLNSLSGEWLSDSWECIARLGTFVEIGKADIYQKNQLSMVPFDKSVTFASVDLVVLFEAQPEEMSERFSKVLAMFESGILSKLEPITAFPMSDIESAFRLISSRKHTGKVVLEVEENTMVKAVPSRQAPLQLEENGSYVVAGGLGDLGKRICRLLASHGAKSIVTLSRRTLDAEAQELFANELEELGAAVHMLQCDIVNESDVQDVILKCKKLPPIRGVIHAGMVLKDHPLEQMTIDDYITGTQPKVNGTINLNNAFQSEALDFFITLSSVSCILGKTGQLNYSAGNAFQDAFAHANTHKSHTQYISLNLGAVDGSDAITSLPVRQRELMRQGAILMKFEELFKVLEYSMGPDARKDELVQSVLGFDRDSMEAAGDTFALNNPMFSQLPQSTKDVGKGDNKVDIEDAVRKAKTSDEASIIITKAIIEKFSLFLNRSIEDLDPDQPPSSFGLDSLVSIELKNWMVRTFKATLQTAEIGDAASLVALARTVTSRSKLVNDDLQGPNESDEAPPVALPDDTVDEIEEVSEYRCCRFAKTFPKYPIMDLDKALRDLLEDVRPFATPEELVEVHKNIIEFKAPGSVARQTYQQLAERASDPDIDNWLFDLQIDGVWLKRRFPLAPFQNFLATHHNSKIPHQQAERAALIATTAFKFKQAVESDVLEPHWYFGVPSCMDTWQWLFNATREPGKGQDKMRKFPGNDYCVVLRRGHVFKVDLKEGEENLSFHRAKTIFEAILDQVEDEGSWAGILTSDERDSWAAIRGTLESAGPANAEYFSIIDRAAFLICLDDGSPTNGPERVRQYYLGDGFNRWHDKCLQFMVCSNGVSGYTVEHTMIDGLTVHELNDWIHKVIAEHKPEEFATNGHRNGHGSAPILEEYVLTTTPDIDNHMDVLREKYLSYTSKREFANYELKSFGNTLLAEHNCPIKATFDLTIQLASRIYFGYTPASWEPVSMAQFHKGRFAIVQVITQSVMQFCFSAADNTIPAPDRRNMLLTAASDYNARLRDTYGGNAYFRLMNAMKTVWPEHEPLAPLFSNPTWLKTHPRLIMSNLTDGGSLDSAYVMGDSESIWISYSVLENEARFSIVGPAGDLKRFLSSLDQAGEVVKGLVLAK